MDECGDDEAREDEIAGCVERVEPTGSTKVEHSVLDGGAQGEQAASDTEDEHEEESASSRQDECWEKRREGRHGGSTGECEIFLNVCSLPIPISGLWDWAKVEKGSTA
jgi:hypothetical protein